MVASAASLNDDNSSNNCYRGLIALNNIGIAFVERGAYDHAKETLQNAANILKALVVRSEEEHDHHDDGSLGKSLNTNLGNATRKLLNLQLQQQQQEEEEDASSSSPIRALAKCNSLILFGDCCSVQQSLNVGGSSNNSNNNNMTTGLRASSPAPPIRMEPLDASPLYAQDNFAFELESAIIVYNIAVAHALMSNRKVIAVQEEDDGNKVAQAVAMRHARALRSKAINLFVIANSVIGDLIASTNDASSCPLALLQVQTAVLTNVTSALEESGEWSRAQEFRFELDRVARQIRAWETVVSDASPAAGAA